MKNYLKAYLNGAEPQGVPCCLLVAQLSKDLDSFTDSEIDAANKLFLLLLRIYPRPSDLKRIIHIRHFHGEDEKVKFVSALNIANNQRAIKGLDPIEADYSRIDFFEGK